ncbi:MAG: pyruvate kinase [Candidatus Neomarinimicrobiota bacterium]|nr:pyruvate kinase [Candidatus Neomarinimicrobiota bacterium]|tara:strand:- start:76 stop:1488 length:1413 start_codon:yes stop_codon:yes gene_type:complete
MIPNKTKILATIGPACTNKNILEQMVKSGVNAFRVNMSHGSIEEKKSLFTEIKKLGSGSHSYPTIIADLAGPKIRIKNVKENLKLNQNDKIIISNTNDINDETITVSSGFTFGKVSKGAKILINDGRVQLEVLKKISPHSIQVKTLVGGNIENGKGVNFPGIGIDMPPLTEQDFIDLSLAIDEGADWIALSFVRSPRDKESVDLILKDKKATIPVIAKIEKWEALENLDKIIDTFDGVMVARGDLGVEIPQEQVPLIQKKIISAANKAGKPVIIATQLLETMIKSPTPTRAEISDIANAIFDGADALLVTGETAIGKFPQKVIEVLNKVIIETERTIDFNNMLQPIGHEHYTADAISHATCQIANDMNIGVILSLTHSGSTARMIARYKPPADIIALTPVEKTYRQLSIIWGVTPKMIKEYSNSDDIPTVSAKFINDNNLLVSGDRYVVTGGVPVGVAGTTNYLFVQKAK